MIRNFKLRIGLLALSLICVLGLMTMTIGAEVKKIDNDFDYKNKLIRFHVLANSDSTEDQDLKYLVRDAVIKYLEPKLSESASLEESEQIIIDNYDELQKISEDIIQENGYNYSVKVGIDYSNFPAKQYSNIVLPAGEYKALRIIIGDGEGQNWWCVMFPPLCFVDESSGVIDKETDDKLREVLTEDEYNQIAQDKSHNNLSNKNSNMRVPIKSKIVEIIENVF